MPVQILEIVAKRKANPMAWVRLTDFETKPAGTTTTAWLMQQPNVSIYCLDHASRQAIFVETAVSADLTAHPFFFQAQYEHAQRLLAVSYDEFIEMGRQSSAEGDDLILIYSVGRCGSTLLANVLKQVDGMYNLSEPDVFTDILRLREPDGSQDDLVRALLRSVLVSLRQPVAQGAYSGWSIKFRSYGIELADLIAEAMPAAKVLFLYREAESWLTSTIRAFDKLNSAEYSVGTAVERRYYRLAQRLRAVGADRWAGPLVRRIDRRAGMLSAHALTIRTRFAPLLQHYLPQLAAGELSRVELIVLGWLSGMQRYLDLHAQGLPMLAVRYEALIAAQETAVRHIFAYCDLPPATVASALQAFAVDSQAGTSIARTAVRSQTPILTPAQQAAVRRMIAQHPDIGAPDALLPGTWRLAAPVVEYASD